MLLRMKKNKESEGGTGTLGGHEEEWTRGRVDQPRSESSFNCVTGDANEILPEALYIQILGEVGLEMGSSLRVGKSGVSLLSRHSGS